MVMKVFGSLRVFYKKNSEVRIQETEFRIQN